MDELNVWIIIFKGIDKYFIVVRFEEKIFGS